MKLTKKQKKILRENFATRSDADLARDLNLAEDNVRNALKSLGLQRTREEKRRLSSSRDVTGKDSRKAVLGVVVLLMLMLVGGYLLYRYRFDGEKVKRDPDLNVLLIIVDTLRADRLSCYGYQDLQTPHIDRLAEEGFLFQNATAQVPLTLPSHCSILTGMYPPDHGVRDNGGFYLEAEKDTLAEMLQRNGYTTGAFIGAFVLDSRWGVDQGFDYYFDDFQLSRYEMVTLEGVQRRGEDVVRETFRWWEENHHRKVFTWIHLYDPHLPYDPPEPFKTEFRGAPKRAYDGEVAYVDQWIGRILDKLVELEKLDDTLIIFAADHGEMLGDHGENGHGFFLYDAATKIPLIIRSPTTAKSGEIISEQVESVDIVPTILDMVGITIPPQVRGRSLLPLLEGNIDRSEPIYAYSETFFPRYRFGWSELRSLRTEAFKYVDAPRPELYDLHTDPGEGNNIFAFRPDVAERFANRLRDLDTGTVVAAAPRMMDQETLEGLMALGYLGAPSAPGKDEEDRQPADPKDRVALYNRIREAERKSAENRIDEALEDITEVLTIDPDVKKANLIAGLLYVKKRDFTNAIRAFQRGREIDPGSAYTVFCLAQAYKEARRWPEAIATFHEVTELDPKFSQSYLHLGDIYIQQKNYDQAIVYLKKSLELEPSAMVHNQLGLCYLEQRRLQDAERELKRAVQLNPDLVGPHYHLGLLYGRLNRFPDAIASLQHATHLRPQYFNAHFYLGLAYGSAGRHREEMESLRTAVRIKPDDADARYLLGMSYVALGDEPSALAQLEALEQMSPPLAQRLRAAIPRK